MKCADLMITLFGVSLLLASSSSSMTTTEDSGAVPLVTTEDPSLMTCHNCTGTADECNVEMPGSKEVCKIGRTCWAYMYIPGEEGEATVSKGCDTIEALYANDFPGTMSCSDLMEEGEMCFKSRGNKHCFRCCSGKDCNTFSMTGNDMGVTTPSGSTSVYLMSGVVFSTVLSASLLHLVY